MARLKRLWWCQQVRRRRSRVNFHLTSRGSLGLFVRISGIRNTTCDMKKLFVLSILVPLAMVCSCQKQDAAAEQQLTQRKADLDAREKALDDRAKALGEREKAIARASTLRNLQSRAPTSDTSSNPQPSASIPAGLYPSDSSQLKASRERKMDEIRALRQRRLEAIQKMRTLGARANPGTTKPVDSGASAGTSGSADTSPSATPGEEATSPSPSPTPQ